MLSSYNLMEKAFGVYGGYCGLMGSERNRDGKLGWDVFVMVGYLEAGLFYFDFFYGTVEDCSFIFWVFFNCENIVVVQVFIILFSMVAVQLLCC